MIASLCHTCVQCQTVVSGRGSTFFLCRLAQVDSQYSKYPPQPVVRCSGYVTQSAQEQADDGK